MGIPSENKNQINRTREEPDPTAFSVKPELDEEKGAGLRGKDKRQGDCETSQDKRQGDLRQTSCRTTASSIRGRNAETSEAHHRARPAEGRIAGRPRPARHRPAAERCARGDKGQTARRSKSAERRPDAGAEEAARSAILRGTVPRNLFHPGMIRTLRDYEYWCHTQKGGHRTLYFLGHEHITRAATSRRRCGRLRTTYLSWESGNGEDAEESCST